MLLRALGPAKKENEFKLSIEEKGKANSEDRKEDFEFEKSRIKVLITSSLRRRLCCCCVLIAVVDDFEMYVNI